METNKYQIEIDNFEENFKLYKDKRIVLYGIGRYTSTILNGVKGYNFVGLMDKDPSLIGEELFGIKILNLEQACEVADLIIINTSEVYWKVIFSRIKESTIPVYYKNGDLGKIEEQGTAIYPYSDLSLFKLENKVWKYDVVSFDFFDTLFSRKVSNPSDVIKMIPIENDIRIRAKNVLGYNYTLDELYDEIQRNDDSIDDGTKEIKKHREIEIEHKLLVPRKPIFDLFKKLIMSDKEVYIISDMYLPKKFYLDELKKYNIDFQENRILISGELKKSKSDGTLWRYYVDTRVLNRKSIHIGDNRCGDVEEPLKYGIDTYYVPSGWDLLGASSIKTIASECVSDYDSRMLGMIISKYYGNPFIDVHRNGKFYIDSFEKMGYLVFGPLILTFLTWLEKSRNKDGIDQLLFLARDGYLLQKDYDLFCKFQGIHGKSKYITISRQLAMTASCKTKEDVVRYLKMPYSGNVKELFEDRLNINNLELVEDHSLTDYIEKNWNEIEDYIGNTREKYLEYLKQIEICDRVAIVDLGFYGNNQRYLEELLNNEMSGYYFCANLSKRNPNAILQKMKSCFQLESDVTGKSSNILKYMMYLESFMTAPVGMAKYIDRNGDFVYAKKGNNQKFFDDKEKINDGVVSFLKDYYSLFKKCDVDTTIGFVNEFYGKCFDGSVEYSEFIKRSFYNDNAMMNRIESSLFF